MLGRSTRADEEVLRTSTIHPRRRRPMTRTMAPQMSARAVAMTLPGMSAPPGCSWTCLMTLDTSSDMTATGPIVTSLDVAKSAYTLW